MDQTPKNEKKVERVTIVLALLLFCSSIYLLIDDQLFNTLFGEQVKGESIATVRSTKNDIRRRNNAQSAWYSLGKSQEVFKDDLLFAGEDSEAVIEFKNGSQLKLDPNTLIALEEKEGSLSLDLKYGAFKGQLSKNESLKVKINGKDQVIQGGNNSEIVIKKNKKGSAEIQVLSGEIKVGQETIKKNQKLAVADSGRVIKKNLIEISLDLPLENETLWLTSQEKINFKWSSPTQLSYRLLIAKDPQFKELVTAEFIENAAQTSLKLEEESVYYWKVISASKEKQLQISSPVRSLNLKVERVPELIYPPALAEFYIPAEKNIEEQKYEWKQKEIVFVVSDPTSAESYELQISDSESFSTNLIYKESEIPRFENNLLPHGEYFWRARVKRSNQRPNTLWSSIGQFKIINQERNLEPLQLLFAQGQNYEIPLLNYPSNFYKKEQVKRDLFSYLESKNIIVPEISYSPSFAATGYELRLKKTAPSEDLETLKIPTPKTSLNILSPGKYQLSTRALYRTGASKWTPPISYQVMVAPTRSTSKKTYSSTINAKDLTTASVKKVSLSWKPTLYTYFYELEVSLFKNFSKSRTLIIPENSAEIKISTNRNYYWRVRSIDKNRNILSRYSEPSTLRWNETVLQPPVILAEETLTEQPEKIELAELDSEFVRNSSRYKAPRFFPWEVKRRDPSQRPNYWASIGAGASLQSLSQTNNQVSVNSVGVPKAQLRAGISNGTIGAEASYQSQPVTFSTPETSQVSSSWKSLVIDGIYSLKKTFNFLERETETNIKAGISQRTTPVIASTSSNDTDLLETVVNNLSLGVDFVLGRIKKIRYEFFVKYNHPISSSVDPSDSFAISPGFTIDSGIGMVYRMTPTSFFGLHLGGQYQRYSVTSSSSGFNDPQSLLFSTIDTQIGFEF